MTLYVHMCVYIYIYVQIFKNPKDSTKKTVRFINKFSKVAEKKLNVQKYVAFIYNNKNVSKREIRKQYHLQLHQIIIKYLGTNF